jgi:hypothetical protein
MKWVTVAGLLVLALGALLALAAFVGSRLPRSHRASKQQTFSATPEAVWLAITDIDAYTSWRKELTRVERLPDRAGMPAWIEESRSGRLELAMEKMERPRLLLVRVTDPEMRFGGTWTYEIEDARAERTVVTITEDGEVYNPLFRFMARYVFGHDGTIATYLRQLQEPLKMH